MKIIKTPIKGLIVINNKKFTDTRGYFREVLLEKIIKKKFIFNVVSHSKKNVIRGLHFQEKKPQGKFVSVIKGKIIDVVVDLRRNSRTYGKHFKIILSERNCTSVYIPEGFAHGFGGLEKENIVIYSNSNYRSKSNEIGIKWNDRDLNIKWPKKNLKISKKDKSNISFKEFTKKYR